MFGQPRLESGLKIKLSEKALGQRAHRWFWVGGGGGGLFTRVILLLVPDAEHGFDAPVGPPHPVTAADVSVGGRKRERAVRVATATCTHAHTQFVNAGTRDRGAQTLREEGNRLVERKDVNKKGLAARNIKAAMPIPYTVTKVT